MIKYIKFTIREFIGLENDYESLLSNQGIILDQLKEKIKGINSYLIGEEKHEDGGIQIHCYLELNIKIDISDVNYLHLILDRQKYLGNYQIGKKKQALIEYIIKENNFITNRLLPIKDGKLLKPEEHLFQICSEEGYHKVEETLYEFYPLLAARKASSLLKNLSKFSDFNSLKKLESIKKENIFKINDFDKLPKEILDEILFFMTDGIQKGFNVTLILHGPPGTGKTQLGKAISNHFNIPFIEISEINDFKSYDKRRTNCV